MSVDIIQSEKKQRQKNEEKWTESRRLTEYQEAYQHADNGSQERERTERKGLKEYSKKC